MISQQISFSRIHFYHFVFCMSLILVLTAKVRAESVSIKDIAVDESTTVEIKKGAPTSTIAKKEYKIIEENSEVTGEPAPLMKVARENWKKACDDWKKEIKSLNTENKVISLNCGKAQCQTTSMETSCNSDGKAKIKIIVSE